MGEGGREREVRGRVGEGGREREVRGSWGEEVHVLPTTLERTSKGQGTWLYPSNKANIKAIKYIVQLPSSSKSLVARQQ